MSFRLFDCNLAAVGLIILKNRYLVLSGVSFLVCILERTTLGHFFLNGPLRSSETVVFYSVFDETAW